jgi:hypothetical protein
MVGPKGHRLQGILGVWRNCPGKVGPMMNSASLGFTCQICIAPFEFRNNNEKLRDPSFLE